METAQLFKCMADQTRLHLTLLIGAEGEVCVCDLMAALAESQSKISRHLAQLRNCRVLADQRRGQWVYYTLHPELPAWARDVLALAEQAERTQLDAQRQRLRSAQAGSICC